MAAARRPPALRGQVFRARDAIDRGLLTRDALRSSAWRRLYRGVYADARLAEGPLLMIAGATLLAPATAAFTGRTAAYLLGAEELLDLGAPVELAVPPAERFGPVAGLRIRQASLPRSHVRRARGYRCTTAVRTALDLARHEPLDEAVPAIDVLLHRGLLLQEELEQAAAALPRGRGSRRAPRAVALADGRAESPPESRLRLLLVAAGLPAVPQYRVLGPDGSFLARVDLGYPDRRVAVEYDGVWHADADQLRRDRRRLNRLVAAGWVVLHLTASDLRQPEDIVRRVQQVLASREIVETGLRSPGVRPTSPMSTR